MNVLGKTPHEAWNGRKPNIGHFNVFGCIAYVHVPNQVNKKIDDKAKNASLFVAVMRQKVTSCTIRKQKRWLLVGMQLLMKIVFGIGQVKIKIDCQCQLLVEVILILMKTQKCRRHL